MEGKKVKLITFVIPAYNVQSYIRECLESVVNQTSDNYSVIIVNDGSTDENTSLICEEYHGKYPHLITYIYQENKGLGAARNTGLQQVKTPWVTFLDSDDWIGTNYVEEFEKRLREFADDSVDLFFTLPKIYDNVTEEVKDWYDKTIFYELFYQENKTINPNIDKRIYWLEVNACRRIYNMKFLERLNFKFPEGVKWEDVYPHFYLLSNAGNCAGIENIGFYYRINTSGQITASSGKGRLDMIKVFAQTFEYLIKSEADKQIIMIALELSVRFSKWSIDVANTETRKLLVDGLYQMYTCIPNDYMKAYSRWKPADKTFVKAICSKVGRCFYYDYFIHDILLEIKWKIFNRKVAH